VILDTFNSGNTTLWRRFMCLPYPSEKKSAYLPACVTLGELAIVFLTLISGAKMAMANVIPELENSPNPPTHPQNTTAVFFSPSPTIGIP
jgi:hypothetical protein